MKTAIIFIGHIRTWTECEDNFIESFGHLNSDVFISTYDLQYNYHPAQRHWMRGTPDNYLSFVEIQNLVSNINVVNLDVESISEITNIYEQMRYKLHPNFQDDSHTYFQYRKLNRAIESIKKEEIKNQCNYDNIIKIRFDIHHNKFNYNIDDKTCIVSTGNVFPNDVIVAATRDNFIKISHFCNSEFFNPIYNDSHLKPPHNLLLRAFDYCNLDVQENDLMKYVVRKTGKQYYDNIK